MQILIWVVDVKGYVEPSINVTIYYSPTDVDYTRNYSFSGWKHFLGHMGDLLPLTNCEIHIYGK